MADNQNQDTGNPVAGLQALLARNNNDAMGVAGLLFSENYQYREQLRQLKEQLQAAQARLPGEGAVVLTPEQGQAFAAYQQLGTVEDISNGLKARDTAQGELATLRRAATLQRAAAAHGYDADVLATLAGDLPFEVREVTADGQTRQAAFVTADGQQVRLDEYAGQKWAKFLPSLSQAGANGGQGAAGTRYPAQGAGGGGQPADVVSQFMAQQEKQRAARPNPLLPQARS